MDRLTPEQLERAKKCRTAEELMQFIDEEDIAIPFEFLEEIVGGKKLSDEALAKLIQDLFMPDENK